MNLEDFDTIAWTRWTELGYSCKASKAHLTLDDGSIYSGDTTLCGVSVPYDVPGTEITPDDGDGMCRRCLRATESQAVINRLLAA